MIDELYFLHKNIRRTVITTYRRPHDKWAYLKIRPFSILRLSKLGYDIYSTRKIRVMANWSLKFTYNYITQQFLMLISQNYVFEIRPLVMGPTIYLPLLIRGVSRGEMGYPIFMFFAMYIVHGNDVHCTWEWCTHRSQI